MTIRANAHVAEKNRRKISESTETPGYVPFGAEWEKEMLKMTKKQLVVMLKDALAT